MVLETTQANTQETMWWAKFFIFSALLSLIILASGPFGYKYGVTDLAPSLISVLVALVGAGLVFIAGIIMVIVASRKNLPKERKMIVAAMLISVIPMIFVLPQMLKARSVPPIHDISTDTTNPPDFYAIVELRKSAPNDLVYAHEGSAETLASLQTKAYPNVKSAETALSVEAAVNRATNLLKAQGLEIVNSDSDTGIVEATATTFWFGFKDDVVVRARESNGKTIVDVRSVSRVGQSDIGANAARIERFLGAFTSA